MVHKARFHSPRAATPPTPPARGGTTRPRHPVAYVEPAMLADVPGLPDYAPPGLQLPPIYGGYEVFLARPALMRHREHPEQTAGERPAIAPPRLENAAAVYALVRHACRLPSDRIVSFVTDARSYLVAVNEEPCGPHDPPQQLVRLACRLPATLPEASQLVVAYVRSVEARAGVLDLMASPRDRAVLRGLLQACAALGVALQDYVIAGAAGYSAPAVRDARKAVR